MQRRPTSVIPNSTQELLLRAAFASEPGFSSWWDQCVQSINPNTLDVSTTTLLPLVQPKLAHVETSALAKRCQLQYRKVWIHNELQVRRAKLIIHRLVQAGIRPILLKGIALTHQYYHDLGMRFMSDVDLLVKPQDLIYTLEILQEFGFQSKNLNLGAFSPEFGKEISLYHPQWEHFFDLHYRLFDCYVQSDITQDYFHAAMPIQLETNGKSIHCLTLCPTDQLFYLCSHGQIVGEHLHVRWVADALKVMLNEREPFDWDRLIYLAEKQGVSRLTWLALDYLNRVWNSDIPSDVVDEIHQMSQTHQQSQIYRLFFNDNQGRMIRLTKKNWYVYRQAAIQKSLLEQIPLFFRFLMFRCNTEHPLRLPYHIAAKFFKHLRFRLSFKFSERR